MVRCESGVTRMTDVPVGVCAGHNAQDRDQNGDEPQ